MALSITLVERLIAMHPLARLLPSSKALEQMVCLTTNADLAREIAAQYLARYMQMPNYRNNWLRLNFDEEELVGRGSNRFLDAIVAWGSAETIRARLKAHVDAGATHVCIQPLNPDGSGLPDWRALEGVGASGLTHVESGSCAASRT